MRKVKYGICLVFVLSVGCVSQAVKDQCKTQAAVHDAYVAKMRAGKTTREQDHAFIEADRRNWHTQNYNVNDALLPADVATVVSADTAAVKTGN